MNESEVVSQILGSFYIQGANSEEHTIGTLRA